MIITGDMSQITRFTPLREQLDRGFFYGDIIQKSTDLADDILRGIEKAQEYVDFGIRLVDSANQARPTLLPREEDLIRRCGLAKGTAVGVDLHWWSAERRDWGAGGDQADWVKVLQGRFILEGEGLSRPNFFKLESKENCKRANASALVMADKLQHVRVVSCRNSGERGLLVTEKAGPSNDSPVRIDTYLQQRTEHNDEGIRSLAEDIATQTP